MTLARSPLVLAAMLSLAPMTPQAQSYDCSVDAMLVFDGSGSMAEISFDTGAATRIDEARAAITRAMPQITPFRDVGLVIYGPGGASSCTGIDVRFPPARDAAIEIITEVNGLRPDGLTPLTASVERAAEVLNYRQEPAVVVLVTDGNETCGGTPCALGERMAAEARDLTVHVIGFRVVVDFFSWNSPEQDPLSTTVSRCLADETGGLFVSTETVDELVDALNATLGCPVIGHARPNDAKTRS
ncbi:MAG: VWA domain-containing protein [Pseudomonadota bacterium]